MYRARFTYLYSLLAAVGTAAVCALLLGPVVLGQPVRVETRHVAQPGLSKSASSADARGRFRSNPQTVDGTQLGFPQGVTCEAYPLRDGVALICHQ